MDLLAADSTGAALLVGVLSPWIIAMVNRPHWSSNVRGAVAIVVSLALGLAVSAGSGVFDSGWQLLSTCATVLVTSQACYRRLFPGSQSALEALTSRRAKAEPVRQDYADADDVPGRHAGDRTGR